MSVTRTIALSARHSSIEIRKPMSLTRVAPDFGRSENGSGAHSYTCLYLRTKRIAIMFISSVIRKRTMPTAKIVL